MAAHKYTLLEVMLEDMESASELYRPTHFWRKGLDEILEDIRKNGVEDFRSLRSALRFFVPTYSYPEYHSKPEIYQGLHEVLSQVRPNSPKLDIRLQKLLSGELHAQSDYRVYLASESDSHPHTEQSTESIIGDPLEQFEFDGRRFSRSSLNYLLGLNFLKRTCAPKGIRTILEIGGGYGSLGEIFLGDPGNSCFYMDVDIPPTAFVATYYLQSRFGKNAIGDYEMLRARSSLSIDELRHEFSSVILCPWQLPKVKGVIDLFVNYISFQEMEPRVVENYLRHVLRLSPHYILLRNLKEGKQLSKDNSDIGVKNPILGQDYDRFLPGYRLTATNTQPFGFETEDGFHFELRLYCQNEL